MEECVGNTALLGDLAVEQSALVVLRRECRHGRPGELTACQNCHRRKQLWGLLGSAVECSSAVVQECSEGVQCSSGVQECSAVIAFSSEGLILY
jgi:hypothetical protein